MFCKTSVMSLYKRVPVCGSSLTLLQRAKAAGVALSLTLLVVSGTASAPVLAQGVSIPGPTIGSGPDYVDPVLVDLFAANPAAQAVVIVVYRDGVQPQAQSASAQSGGISIGLPVHSYRVVTEYEALPLAALEVTKEGFEALQLDSRIEAIEANDRLEASTPDANALTGAATVHTLDGTGYTGRGLRAAVIDSGVDTDHPGLADSIFFQRCFRAENKDCPNGNDINSAEDHVLQSWTVGGDTVTNGGGHGTHVSGIITGPNGAAPDVQIAALKVFGYSDYGAQTSDLQKALDYIVANQAVLEIDFVNLSLGGGKFSDRARCDNDRRSYARAFGRLNALGITVFAATGNGGHLDGISYPACATGAIGVGSSRKDDTVSGFSNTTPNQGSGRMVDLLAPGSDIWSTIMGGSEQAKSGTSMATPYALGVAALAREYADRHALSLTPASLEQLLRDTGTPIRDGRLPASSPTFPRVNALAAIERLKASIPVAAVLENSPANATMGLAYSFTYRVGPSDATRPITFSVANGALPPGLSLDRDTGVISGIPASAGTFNFTLALANAAGVQLSAQSITVAAVGVVPVITGTPPAATVGVPYTFTPGVGPATVTRPIHFEVAGGDLPPGLNLNSATGEIQGVPSSVGNFSFRLRAINVAGISDELPLQIAVQASSIGAAGTPTPVPGLGGLGLLMLGASLVLAYLWFGTRKV